MANLDIAGVDSQTDVGRGTTDRAHIHVDRFVDRERQTIAVVPWSEQLVELLHIPCLAGLDQTTGPDKANQATGLSENGPPGP